jgi:acetylornithine deacetylase/succinyl-diaminopimelate desuccinylase-like protein
MKLPGMKNSSGNEPRAGIAACNAERIAEWTLRLVRAASPNPPGDTRLAAATAADILRQAVPSAEIVLHAASDNIVNVVARVRGAGPGKRVVLNGHLDTYPVGDVAAWTRDPAGEVVGDRLYGRGAADMKGGIAASISALAALARYSHAWPGEVVLTLAGDEESMGPLGTRWLLDTVPHASGDAVIIGDAGSPRVLRFGEKGFLWLEIEAEGKAAHGAHVHLGDNALERLIAALTRLQGLRDLPADAPPAVRQAITASMPVSEPLAGAGEAAVLGRATVNIGRVEGGTSTNLVPSRARAGVDIRLPVGITATAAERAIASALQGVSYRILRRFEPNYTAPGHALVRCCAAAARQVVGRDIAVNMRVGGSDARWFRMAGMPTVVYGPTPHGMGGPDEWVDRAELDQVARVHALTAFDMLTDRQG